MKGFLQLQEPFLYSMKKTLVFCKGKLYKGNYSSYVVQKETDREIQERHYKNQQKEIARIEAYIEQQRRWNREKNIIAAESRQKMLDKMVKLERPKEAPIPELAPYFAWKGQIGCVRSEEFSENTFGPDLADRVLDFFVKLMPLYDYFNNFKV